MLVRLSRQRRHCTGICDGLSELAPGAVMVSAVLGTSWHPADPTTNKAADFDRTGRR